MEIRSLFKNIFGSKDDKGNSMRRFEVLTSSNSVTSWHGNIFDSDIVRACIRPKVNAIGKLNAKHIRGTGENMKINPDPYIKEILQRPNRYMSMQDFLMKMVWQRELNHNAFAYIKRDDFGYPVEIYPVPYSSVDLLEAQGELFVRFRFMLGKSMTVPYEDLIHLRKDFNDNDLFGETGINALRNLMEVIDTSDKGLIQAVKNSNIIKWLLKFNQSLRPEDVTKQTKDFIDNYLSIDSALSGAIGTDVKADVQQVKSESYVPNAAITRDHIQRLQSYFGVNDAIVQNKYTEDEFNSFYESEIEPILIQLINGFTNGFFTKRERGFDNKIIFEASNLAYASMNTKLSLVQLVDRGALTPNEWRSILNLGPIEGGDKPIRRLDTALVNDVKEQEGDDKDE